MLWIVWIVAAAGMAVCVYQWFGKVQRIMGERKSNMEMAAGQLAACRRMTIAARYDPELAETLAHSESIYRQAEELYNRAFYRPWVWLPAVLIGFRPIPPEDYYMLGRNWKA